MGAGQSDLYNKTFGDNIGNIPSEANPESKEKNIYDEKAIDEYKSSVLTDVQKANIEKLQNTIKDHLKESDFKGARADLEGHPIIDKNGKPFAHLDEMKDSYRSLKKISGSIKGSLLNPNLGPNEQKALTEALNLATDMLNKIEALFNEFGGA